MIKRFFVIIFTAGFLAIFLCGCTERSSIPLKKKTTKPKTTKPGIIEYTTGSQQIKVYQRTKSKLDSIKKAREKQYEGFLD